MIGFHKYRMGRSKLFDCGCNVEIDRIIWDDGCIRIWYNNGKEKYSKVLCEKGTMWSFVERDIDGKIIKQYLKKIK